MNPDAILEKVKEVIIEQLSVEDDAIKLETSFIDDLGADSLDIVEIIYGQEEAFDMQIPDSEAEKITTVGDVVEYIKAANKKDQSNSILSRRPNRIGRLFYYDGKEAK